MQFATRQMARIVVVAAVTVASAFALPAPVWAHSQLLSTQPAAGSTVTAPVQAVVLTFSEKLQAGFCEVVVDGPGGAYGQGPLTVADTVLRQPVSPLRSGAYRVAWRVVADDGHPTSGEFSFTVRLPAQLEPSAGAPPSAGDASGAPVALSTSAPAATDRGAGGGATGGGSPWLVWLIVIAVFAGLAATLLLRRWGTTPAHASNQPDLPEGGENQ
jgi:methionine-rich copper-binding protein CopC